MPRQPRETPSPTEEPQEKKRRLVDRLLFALLAGVIVFALWPKKSSLTLGELAPEVRLPLLGTQEPIELSSCGGRPLLIEAFASWCTACRRSNATLHALENAARSGAIDIVAVSVDDEPENAESAQKSWPIPVPVLHDTSGEFSRRYQIRTLPSYILLDADGRIRDVTIGIAGTTDIRRWLREAKVSPPGEDEPEAPHCKLTRASTL